MHAQSAPVLQSVKNPDRKTCRSLTLILLHFMDIIAYLAESQGPILPQGGARGLPLYLERKSLIGSFA
jgi:hypothetical protein